MSGLLTSARHLATAFLGPSTASAPAANPFAKPQGSNGSNGNPFGGNKGGQAAAFQSPATTFGQNTGTGSTHTTFGKPKQQKSFSSGPGASEMKSRQKKTKPSTSFGQQQQPTSAPGTFGHKTWTPSQAPAQSSAFPATSTAFNPFQTPQSNRTSKPKTTSASTVFGQQEQSNGKSTAFGQPNHGHHPKKAFGHQPPASAPSSSGLNPFASSFQPPTEPSHNSEHAFGRKKKKTPDATNGFPPTTSQPPMQSYSHKTGPPAVAKKQSKQGMMKKVKPKVVRSQQTPAPSAMQSLEALPDRSPSQSPSRDEERKQRFQMKKPPKAADENAPVKPTKPHKSSYKSAQNLDGTCVDMCSPTERELHIRIDELSVFEKCFPGYPNQEKNLIIKRFQRSSADHKLDIPEEIRPPGVLRRTQLYIEQHIMDRDTMGDDPRFNPPRPPDGIELYNFCWDRCRMLRKDFVLQNFRSGGRAHPIALDVHERVARYHVLSGHELCDVPSFVAQQNMEQLGQTLKSLNELYDESRKQGDATLLSPFEAECRAYFMLCTLDNGQGSDVLQFFKGLPPTIASHPHVKFAMEAFVARHTSDYYAFFQLLKRATYLQSCLLFRYVDSMRSVGLQRMNRAFGSKSLYPLAQVTQLLCFDDDIHARTICEQHGLEMVDKEDETFIRFGGDFWTDVQLRKDGTPIEVRRSEVYVDAKKEGFLRKDICRGVTEYETYPRLSVLIKETEEEEKQRLYPDRPEYDDPYSVFNDSMAPAETPQVDAAKKQALLKKQEAINAQRQEMMRRIQLLEAERKEKVRAEEQQKEEARKQEEEARKQEQRKKKEEQEVERRKEEERLKEESRKKEELRQRMEEERQREMERQMKEEEKRRADEMERQRQQKLAEERERHRQEELAKERERQRLQAEQRERERQQEEERQRQLQLVRAKAQRRAAKMRRAMLQLRLYQWRKRLQRSKVMVQWLFPTRLGKRSREDEVGGGKRRKLEDTARELWAPVDVMAVVCGKLKMVYVGRTSVAWKMLVADVQDDCASVFGTWCASKIGVSDISKESEEPYVVLGDQSTQQSIGVCCRYVDASSSMSREALSGTSSVLLPLALSTLSNPGNVSRWEANVKTLLDALSTTKLSLFLLVVGPSELIYSNLLSQVETVVRSLQEHYPIKISSVDSQLIVTEEDMIAQVDTKMKKALTSLAIQSSPPSKVKRVDVKEVVEKKMEQVLAGHKKSSLSTIQSAIKSIMEDVASDVAGASQNDFPPFELQQFVIEPPYGWNAPEPQRLLKTFLRSLKETQVEDSSLEAVSRQERCDVCLQRLMTFIDRLFGLDDRQVSTKELKRLVYKDLVPVHEKLVQTDDEVLIPWSHLLRQIYSVYLEASGEFSIYVPLSWQLTATRVETTEQDDDVDTVIDQQERERRNQSIAKALVKDLKKKPESRERKERLRQLNEKIARERAVTTDYRRYLRDQLYRWDGPDQEM